MPRYFFLSLIPAVVHPRYTLAFFRLPGLSACPGRTQYTPRPVTPTLNPLQHPFLDTCFAMPVTP